MPTTKVFVYNVNTDPNSQADLKELFTAYGIFGQVDVLESDFNFNLDGLSGSSNPTFVVPGGNALFMSKLKPHIAAMTKHFGAGGFNFFGVCAGGLVATAETHFFTTDYQYNTSTQALNLPRYIFAGSDLRNYPVNLGLVPEYTAVGCFYPNDAYAQCKTIPKSVLVPHRVKLTLDGAAFYQLYVRGPGFFPVDEKQNDMVVATYSDAAHYDFALPSVKDKSDPKKDSAASAITNKRISNLPAILCRKPKEAAQGGIFLSGLILKPV